MEGKTLSFLEKLRQQMMLPFELTLDTDLTEYASYDSLTKMTMVALTDEVFGMEVSPDRVGAVFRNVRTVRELFDELGIAYDQ